MRLAALIALLAGFYSGSANAMPIAFSHGGNASGTLGDIAFDGEFTIHAQANTNSISSFGTGFSLEHLFTRIAIAGLGTFEFLSPTRTYVNNRRSSVGFARGAGPDLLNGPVGHAVLSSWNMRSSLALIHGQGSLVQWGLSPIRTSGGTLYFDTNTGTSSRFSAQVALPIPGTWALVLTMFPLLVHARRRRPSP